MFFIRSETKLYKFKCFQIEFFQLGVIFCRVCRTRQRFQLPRMLVDCFLCVGNGTDLLGGALEQIGILSSNFLFCPDQSCANAKA
jgi:hypothetical protein